VPASERAQKSPVAKAPGFFSTSMSSQRADHVDRLTAKLPGRQAGQHHRRIVSYVTLTPRSNLRDCFVNMTTPPARIGRADDPTPNNYQWYPAATPAVAPLELKPTPVLTSSLEVTMADAPMATAW
jgi:hypothetical protein